jgi:thiol-disulfide isomerase/thioredoxin
MKRVCIGIAFCVASTVCGAQKIKPLKIGDKCPDFVFRELLNYKPGSRLSDFKNKLVILDFGATGCHPCVASARLLDSFYTHQFKNQIMPIWCMSKISWSSSEEMNAKNYYNRKESVNNFLRKNEIGKKLRLPIDWGDTTLFQYFPHSFYPHTIWINNKGIVIAITDHTYITAENISKALSGTRIDWPVKYDEYNVNKPLVVFDSSNTPFLKNIPAVISYSSFSNHLDGISQSFQKKYDSAKQTFRVQMINMPVVKMYMLTNERYWTVFPPTHILYEVKDKSRYDYEQFDKGDNRVEWEKKNTYCYDAVFPAYLSKEEIKEQVTNQLDMALGIQGRFEKKQVDCWVLESNLKFTEKVKQNPSADSLWRNHEEWGYISIADILFQLNWHNGNPPVVDETGITNESQEKHYLWLPSADFGNKELMNEQIQPYGLSIVSGKQEVEMLVITENGYNADNK